MPDLEPITREEMLLDGEDLTPITRKEMFIKRIYDKTQEVPEPVTREEMFLKKAGEGSGEDVTIEQLNVTANGTYSESGKAYSPVVVNVPTPTPPENAYLLEEYEDVPTDIASFTASDAPLNSLTASIVPVQDLHGYDSPWAGGAGKNKVDGGTLAPSASNTNYAISPTLATGNYVLSFDVSNLAWTNLNNASFAWTKDSNNTQKDLLSHSIKRVSDNAYLKDLTQPVTGRFYGVFSNVEIASLVIACRNNTYMYFTSGTITNIQLESGSTPTSYAPYSNICPISGWTEEVISVRGKNLLDADNIEGLYPNTEAVKYGQKFTAPYTYYIKKTITYGTYISAKVKFANNTWSNSYYISNGTGGTPATINLSEGDELYVYDELHNKETSIQEFKKAGIMVTLGSYADEYKAYNGTTTTIPFTDGQGQSVEVFGGSVDVINGVVTPCPYYASYNGEQLTGEWISDRDVYSPNTTPTIGAQVVNIGATGTQFYTQPTSIKSLDGDNNVFASTGQIENLEFFTKEA